MPTLARLILITISLLIYASTAVCEDPFRHVREQLGINAQIPILDKIVTLTKTERITSTRYFMATTTVLVPATQPTEPAQGTELAALSGVESAKIGSTEKECEEGARTCYLGGFDRGAGEYKLIFCKTLTHCAQLTHHEISPKPHQPSIVSGHSCSLRPGRTLDCSNRESIIGHGHEVVEFGSPEHVE